MRANLKTDQLNTRPNSPATTRLRVCCETVRRGRRFSVYVSLLLLAFAFSCSPDQTHAQDSLDDQLFEDLDDDLFSDLPPLEKPASKEPAKQSELDRKLQSDLGGEDLGEARASNPLQKLADAMQRVRNRLNERNLTVETQQIQGKIVSDLDEIIAQLAKQKPPPKGKGGGGKPKPQQSKSQSQKKSQQPPKPGGGKPGKNQSNNPAKDSTTRVGQADSAEVDDATRDRMMQEAWGNLPASVRQQMQSARPEKFLPKYSRLIEDYFKRLSEEKKQ